jgi:hypothetical protein
MRSSIAGHDYGVDLDLKGEPTRATLFFGDGRRTFDVASGDGVLVGGKGDQTSSAVPSARLSSAPVGAARTWPARRGWTTRCVR